MFTYLAYAIYISYAFIYSHPVISFIFLMSIIACFTYILKRSSPKIKKIILGLLTVLVLFIMWLFLIPAKPEFPVEYSPLFGVDDYINGNAIAPTNKRENLLMAHLYGWKDWTKEGSYPLITEDDWVIVMIDSGKQKQAWGIEYSKEDLIGIAQQEIEWRQKVNKDGRRNEEIARIQSFIDILSKR